LATAKTLPVLAAVPNPTLGPICLGYLSGAKMLIDIKAVGLIALRVKWFSQEASMKNAPLALLVLTTTLSLNMAAFAQTERTDLGKKEYDLECGICHGADAKGNGVFGASLKVVPPDLTVLAKKTGEYFQPNALAV
jgi:mono/diheme cytochrome c family protein